MERTVTLEEDKDAGQLHTLKNSVDEKHRIVITHKELGECKLTGTLRAVHYGQYNGRSAALILLRFTFHYATDIRIFRYTSASISINFSRTVSDIPSREPIIVRNFFPAAVFGEASIENIQWNYDIPLVIGASPLPSVSRAPKVGRETTFTRTNRMEIRGIATGHPNPKETNVVQWYLSENKLQKTGIPHYFQCGVVVVYGQGEFKADVAVKVSTGLRVGSVDPRAWALKGFPWPKDDPILFDCATVTDGLDTLPQLRGMDLSTLTEEQCRNLAPLPAEYQVFSVYSRC